MCFALFQCKVSLQNSAIRLFFLNSFNSDLFLVYCTRMMWRKVFAKEAKNKVSKGKLAEREDRCSSSSPISIVFVV